MSAIASTTKRLLIGVVAVAGLLLAALAFSVPAGAAYPPTSGTSPIVTTQTPGVGGSVGVSGSGCGPSETIDISLDHGAYPLGTTTTDSSGAYNTTVTLPAGVSGSHSLDIVGEASGCSGAAALDIGATTGSTTGSGNTNSGGLASTGVAVAGIGAVGAALLVGGGLMVMAGRRRRAAN